MAFYTRFLVIPAVFGVLAFVLALVVEHVGTVTIGGVDIVAAHLRYAFAVVVFVWATIFIKSWERRQAGLAYLWNAEGAEKTSDRIVRPAFVYQMKRHYGSWERRTQNLRNVLNVRDADVRTDETRRAFAPEMLQRDLTHHSNLYFYPMAKRRAKFLLSYPLVTTLTVALLICLVMLYLYNQTLPQEGEVPREEVLRAYSLLAVANGLAIPLFNWLYRKLAVVLTDWEYHRVASDYQDSLIFKLFIFRFVNSYGSLFLIAFFERNLDRLATQLAAILVIGAVINNIQELGTPWLLNWQRSRNVRNELGDEHVQIDIEVNKVVRLRKKVSYSALELDEDFLEMVIQWGYVTMFVVAFPLAPAVALLNNVMELRIDANKLCTLTRRPRPRKVAGIGSWARLMDLIALIAIVTNVLLVGYTDVDDYEAVLGPFEWTRDPVWVMLALEHVIILIKLFLSFAIPNESAAVTVDRFRQEFFLVREDEAYRDRNDASHVNTYLAEMNACDNGDDRFLGEDEIGTSVLEADAHDTTEDRG